MRRSELAALIDCQPRAVLTHLPTPLEYHGDFWVKRDDQTGLAFGGSKLRMLEFFLGKALRQKARIMVTAGPPQSNHCRLTAAVSAKLGLQCRLLIIEHGNEHNSLHGNRLLNRLLGAEMIPISRASAREDIDGYLSRLQHDEIPFYFIEGGGHSPPALWGYLQAAVEILGQLDAAGVRPECVFLACGRGTTQAGLLLGMRLLGCPTRVLGVSVARNRDRCKAEIHNVIDRFCHQYGLKNPVTEPDIEIDDQWIGPAYDAVPSERWQCIIEHARQRGLLLDPLYTARAMQGLMDYRRQTNDRSALLLHTGGLSGLFDSDLHGSIASLL